MGFLSIFKHLFGFGDSSIAPPKQLADTNPTTGYAMVSGTLYDVGGNNVGAPLSSDFEDPFSSESMAQPFDMSFGSSDFDSF